MVNYKTWHPQPKQYKSGPFTAEAPGFEKVPGETIPRRNIKTKDSLKSRPDPNIATIYDIVTRSSSKFGNAKALGSRKLVKTHNEVKKVKKMVDGKEQEIDKTWTYFELGHYNYMSFIEYERMTLQVGCGFRKLGLKPQDRVQIFAATR